VAAYPDRIVVFLRRDQVVGEVFQNLRSVLMLFCVLLFVIGFGGMLVSMWRHHRSERVETPNFHGSLAVEICWALTPCVIVVLMVLPTVKVVFGV